MMTTATPAAADLTKPAPRIDFGPEPDADIDADGAEAFLHDHTPVGGPRYERHRVTADEYRFFRQWGYLVVRGLVPPEDVDELDRHTRDLMAGRLPEQRAMDEFDPAGRNGAIGHRGEENTTRVLFRPPEGLSDEQKAAMFLRIHMLHQKLPLHERFLLHPRVLDVLEAIIGPDVISMQSMLFLKPPGKVGQGWHQDSYYIPTHPDTLCGAWLAIDDADELNGALWMAKGSAAEPVHPPCPKARDGVQAYGFGDRLVEDVSHVQGASEPDDANNTLAPVAGEYDQVLVRVSKGDVVFFNGHVLHRSRDNVTKDRFRRAFVGHYCNARSLTQWGAGNWNHTLARGDTHLPYAQPRFGTPCAALLPEATRKGHFDGLTRTLAEHGSGLMGCGIGVPDDHDHDDAGAGGMSGGGMSGGMSGGGMSGGMSGGGMMG